MKKKLFLLLSSLALLCFTCFNSASYVPKPIMEFQVLSDTHISTDIPKNSFNLNIALSDIKNNSKNSSGIFINGDAVDYCSKESYDLLNNLITNQKNLPPIYYAIGNHEFFNSSSLSSNETISNFLTNTNTPNVYYDKWIKDYHFIFLGSEEYPIDNFASLSMTQLLWLEKTLSINSSLNKPIFIFIHQPLKNTVSGSIGNQGWNGVKQDAQLKNLLMEYPQAIVFTGHTHWKLGSHNTYYKNVCNFLNTSSVSYLSTDSKPYIYGSEGYYIKVYNDKVLIKGRNFSNHTWIENAEFTITY